MTGARPSARGLVDLIAASIAAHWHDVLRFYPFTQGAPEPRRARQRPAPSRLPTARATGGAEPTRRYARAALRSEWETIASTPEGGRNQALNRGAFNLGQLTASGHLAESEVRCVLDDAAERCGLPAPEAASAIRSGLAAGQRQPRKTAA